MEEQQERHYNIHESFISYLEKYINDVVSEIEKGTDMYSNRDTVIHDLAIGKVLLRVLENIPENSFDKKSKIIKLNYESRLRDSLVFLREILD